MLEIKKRFNWQPRSITAEPVTRACLEQLSCERSGDTTYRLAPDLLEDVQAFASAENAVLKAELGINVRPLNAVPAWQWWTKACELLYPNMRDRCTACCTKQSATPIAADTTTRCAYDGGIYAISCPRRFSQGGKHLATV